jgi:hypothetical protein
VAVYVVIDTNKIIRFLRWDMNYFSKIWNDPVWSKVISYVIIVLISILSSAIFTYFTSNLRNTKTILEVLLNYNLSVNLFFIVSLLIFVFLIMTGFLYKNIFLKYDVFISAPMSGFETEKEYSDFRLIVMDVIRLLERKCGFKNIYYAGEHKTKKSHFSTPKVAFLKDLAALKNSKRFVLIHPGKIYSSTIFECGYAYRKQIKSIYFIRRLDELPFLMRHLSDVASFVSIFCVGEMNNIINAIENDKKDLF